MSRKYFRTRSIHVPLNERNLCNMLVKKKVLWTYRQMKKDSVLNEDEILAEEVKKYGMKKAVIVSTERCRIKCFIESCRKIFGEW